MLELNLLARVMESPGDPCDQLKNLYLSGSPADKATADTKTNNLKALAQDYTNLVYVEKELEAQV
jgi:hypothetical protein